MIPIKKIIIRFASYFATRFATGFATRVKTRITTSAAIFAVTCAIVFGNSACDSDSANPYKQGKESFKIVCADCHGEDGLGLRDLVPPLAKSDYLQKNFGQFPCLSRKGLADTIVVNGKKYWQPMPKQELTDIQITNIMNYMAHAWGNNLPEVHLTTVQRVLKDSCQ